jgi:DNA-binding NtrC family response regulator
MSIAITKRTGRDFLEQRSALGKRFQSVTAPLDVLVVEDRESDLKLILSSLRLVLGVSSALRSATSRGAMLEAVKQKAPNLIFLDDLLLADRAEVTMPALKAAGYHGSVVIISGLVTRTRLVELSRLGAIDVIHKDDLNSSRLKEAVLKSCSDAE